MPIQDAKNFCHENTKGGKHETGLEFDELSNRVIAAAIQVHKGLGPGFLESIYEQALAIELGKRGIKFEAQKEVAVHYDGRIVGKHVLDVLVEGELIVELKAVRALEDVHFAQLRSYLRATGIKVGLLMNFAEATLRIKRMVN